MMKGGKTDLFTFDEAKVGYLNSKEDKFKLIGCPRNGIHCSDILIEINKLYAESELARINKEYQKSVELLQNVYYKTFELSKPYCSKCVDLFRSSINQTLGIMQDELYEMSFGIFHKRRYQKAYEKLTNFLRKLNFFEINDVNIVSNKRVS